MNQLKKALFCLGLLASINIQAAPDNKYYRTVIEYALGKGDVDTAIDLFRKLTVPAAVIKDWKTQPFITATWGLIAAKAAPGTAMPTLWSVIQPGDIPAETVKVLKDHAKAPNGLLTKIQNSNKSSQNVAEVINNIP